MGEPLAVRRELLSRKVLPSLADPAQEGPRFDAAPADLIVVVRAMEGRLCPINRLIEGRAGRPI